MPPDAPPPTSLIRRFGLFIEALKRAMADGIRPREHMLAAMAVPLWNYLAGTLRRLAALHARFEAGTLAPARGRGRASRRASDRPTTLHRSPCIPPGPVLLRYRLVHFLVPLRELLDDPEMRALLAAAPQAGRLLRPLWRKLTPDPLPEPLRLPPKPPRSEQPLLAEPEAASTAPAARPASPPDPLVWPRPAAPAKPPPSLPAWPPPLWPA